MQADPVMIMADTFVRMVTVEIVQVAIWAPLIIVTAWLHARWLRRER